MDWKVIRNAGHICSQANLPKNQKFAIAAEFLEKVVEEFARASNRYCQLVSELPFIYGERQINSVLLPAVAKIADASLIEMLVTHEHRRRSSHGWLDYWACYQEVDLLIEVKHSWQAASSNQVRKATTKAWKDLKIQLDSLSPGTVDYTLSGQPLKVALLIIPCYQGSKYSTDLEQFNRTKTTAIYDLIKTNLGDPAPNWSSIWHLRPELQQPFLYNDDWYELHPCVIFMASILNFE